ncbi:MAG: hypothetical protein ABEI74_01620 [Candidatus Pacearchaeota archaeon]
MKIRQKWFKNNPKMKKNTTLKMIGIELVLLVVIVLVIFQLSPGASLNRQTGAASQEILKFKNAHAILIDDNSDFTSPQRIDGNKTTLEPDKYYWKAIGLLGETKTGNFTIDSEVVINVKEKGNKTEVQNIGNVPVNITTREGKVVRSGLVVEEGSSLELNGTNKSIKGEQK